MSGTSRSGPMASLAELVLQHQRATLGLVALLTLVAGLLASRLKVQPNILDMLPEDEPTTQAIRQLNEEEGGTGLLSITITGGEAEVRQAFAQELAGRLQQWEEVEWVLHQVDPQLAQRLGLLQLTPDELAEIKTRVQAALALGPAAQNPMLAGRLLALGPLTDKLQAGESVQLLSGRPDQDKILVRPAGTPFDLPFSRPLMARVNDLLDELQPQARGLEIAWVGGPYRHAVEDMETVLHDLLVTVSVSVGLVVLFLGAAFGRPRAVLLIFAPLVVGNIWTLGLAGLVVGQLNTFTSYFTAVLVGLGVDFGIHLYSRYREERARSDDAHDAVIAAWDSTAGPCITAAVTSAAGFCALWIAGFQGFQQLGTLLAGGVILCLVAELLLLPILLVRFEDRVVDVPTQQGAADDVSHYRWAPPGLALMVLLALGSLPFLPHIPFQYDISEMRGEGQAYADLDATERAEARASYTPVVVSFDSDQEAARAQARVDAAIQADQAPMLAGTLSIHSVLPPDQEQRLALLRDLAELARDPDLRYLPPPVQDNLARVAGTPLASMSRQDLPASIRQIVGARGELHRILLLPDGNMWDVRDMVTLRQTVRRLLPDQVAAGEYLATAVLFDLMKRDAPRIAGLALILVFLASLADLRNFWRALLALLALVAGISVAGAGMAVTGLQLSMVNFVSIPILMGIGIDVVIHLQHRIFEEGPGRVKLALRTTGWAAVMSGLTTIISFASLVMADSQGVEGLGKLVVLGLALVMGGTFVVVPLGWMSIWHFKGERPRA